MSNNKIFKISNIYILLCGIDCWDESIEIRGGRDYRYLASIWTIRLFNRCCDICKEFRFEILAIHSSHQKFNNKKGKAISDPAFIAGY